jgi:methylated-DNA-[protein]-cysteine S-methyltransferase
MPMIFFGYHESPIGLIEVGCTSDAVRSLNFVERQRETSTSNAVVEKAVRQIKEYFAGDRREFDVPVDAQGTPFQKAVWRRLLEIPYGRTASYRDIARSLGNPKAVRAVGGANGRNPIAIIVPCHRIIGSDGSLTGYGSGIWRKEWLLEHEGWSAGDVRSKAQGVGRKA